MVTPQEDNESIVQRVGAANLLALRASTGLSQAQFAAAIGLSERALRRYERGERELPQATRLAVIERFKFDLLATDRLATEVGAAKVMLSPMPTAAIREPRDFWASLRQEQKVFREKNYTRLGQIILTWRDHAYFTATAYFAMKHLSFALDIPFGIEVHGIDWMFLASAATILLLISSVVAEMPVFKVARHLLRVGKSYFDARGTLIAPSRPLTLTPFRQLATKAAHSMPPSPR